MAIAPATATTPAAPAPPGGPRIDAPGAPDATDALARLAPAGPDPVTRMVQAEARIFSNDLLQVSAASVVDARLAVTARPGKAATEETAEDATPAAVREGSGPATTDWASPLVQNAFDVQDAQDGQAATRPQRVAESGQAGDEIHHDTLTPLVWTPQSVALTPGFEAAAMPLVGPIGWSVADQHAGAHGFATGLAGTQAGMATSVAGLQLAGLAEQAAGAGVLAVPTPLATVVVTSLPAAAGHGGAAPALDEMLSSSDPHEHPLLGNVANAATRPANPTAPHTAGIDPNQLLNSLLAHREEV